MGKKTELSIAIRIEEKTKKSLGVSKLLMVVYTVEPCLHFSCLQLLLQCQVTIRIKKMKFWLNYEFLFVLLFFCSSPLKIKKYPKNIVYYSIK